MDKPVVDTQEALNAIPGIVAQQLEGVSSISDETRTDLIGNGIRPFYNFLQRDQLPRKDFDQLLNVFNDEIRARGFAEVTLDELKGEKGGPKEAIG